MVNTRVQVSRYGGPDVLEVVEEPLRAPGIGEVRIKVECAGVALADIMRREGLYPASPVPPFTPGYDVVGIVDELGEDVQQFAKGERVAVLFNGVGGYAAYVYVKADELVPVPVEVDAALAASVILNYVTAYQMLHRIAKVSEGERILIHGASGGVGTALLELGKLAKLQMFGTASAAKHEIVAAYGATPIDYRNEDFVSVLREHAPEGIDAVFDPIGGDNWSRSFETLSDAGRFVGYGYTSILQDGDINDWVADWTGLAAKNRTEHGQPVYLYSATTLKQERMDWFREDLQHLFKMLQQGKLNPVISHRVPLQEAAHAQQLLEKSLAVGKVVLIG